MSYLTSIHGHLVEFYGKNQTWQARKNWTMKMAISYFTSMFSGHMCVFDPGCVWIWPFFLPKIKNGWFHTLTNLESAPCVSLELSHPHAVVERHHDHVGAPGSRTKGRREVDLHHSGCSQVCRCRSRILIVVNNNPYYWVDDHPLFVWNLKYVMGV